MDTAEILLAIEEIKALKARYFRFIDFKDWAGYRTLFVDDLVVEAPDGSVSVRGADEFARNVEALLGPSVSIHHGYMPEIEIRGPTEAKGIWVMHDIITWEHGDPRLGNKRMLGWGHYHETYRKVADGWRIASLRLTRLHVETSK